MASRYGRIVLLSFLGFFAAYLLAVHILGKERAHKLQPSEFITLYQKKAYQSLVSKIAQQKYVIIEGLTEDGVDVFADYVLNITLSEQHTVNHRVFSNVPDIQDNSYPHFSLVRSAIADKIGGEGANRVWIIDSDTPLTQTHLKVAFGLASTGKDDRIILIAPESNVKNKLFKKVTYDRPSDSSVAALLKSQGLSEYQAQTVLENHKNNLHTINQALNENTLLDYEKAFQTEKENIVAQLHEANKKITTNLNKLCNAGTLSSKKEIEELKPLSLVTYIDGNYYWTSNNYLQAYQSVISKNCQQPTLFANQVEVQQPEIVVQVPVEPVEQPVVVQQTKQKKVKQNKKDNSKNTKTKSKKK